MGARRAASPPTGGPAARLIGDRRRFCLLEHAQSTPTVAGTDVSLLVDGYRAGWFGHDVNAIMAVVAEDIVFHNVTSGERVEGAAAFRAHVAGIHERWPDLSFEEHALYIAADTGVAEWTARATAADGRRLEWDGIDVINCRAGRITRNAVYSSAHAPRVLGQ